MQYFIKNISEDTQKITKYTLSVAQKIDEEKSITKQTSGVKPPTHEQKKCGNKGTALDRSLEIKLL